MVKLSTQFLLKNLIWSISFLIATNIGDDCIFVGIFGNNSKDNFEVNFGDNSWSVLGSILGTILEAMLRKTMGTTLETILETN